MVPNHYSFGAHLKFTNLVAALDEIERAQLVLRLPQEETPGGAGRGALFIFKHALTQEAAYQSLLLKKRRDLHGRIAKGYEELNPSCSTKMHRFWWVIIPKQATIQKSSILLSVRARRRFESTRCANLRDTLRKPSENWSIFYLPRLFKNMRP
jgi:hypothetical protein